MASKQDTRAHSSDREPRRKRDKLLRPFRSKKSTAATITESQTLKSEQSSKEGFRPSSSKSAKSGPVSFDSQNSSLIVNPIKNLPPEKENENFGITGSQPQDLWMCAYNALEVRAPDLMAAYACHIDSTTSTQHGLDPRLIENTIHKKLHDNEAKKLVFSLGSESVKVREQGERIIKFILWSNNFISTAVSAQPYAALAWSGVSVLLPLLLNSSKQKEIMLTGLKSITELLRLYKIREELYLQTADESPRPDLVKAIVELYTDIFEYQVTLILYLSGGSFRRGYQSTFERDNWKGMLDKIQSSHTRCTEYTELSDTERENRFYTEQSAQLEQSNEIQKCILEAFEAFRGARQQDHREDKEAELLQTLASDYKTDKDSLSSPVPGTCKWVFEDKRFLDWRDSKHSRLLWISAGPGCGKSVLSRCLIDEKRLGTNIMTSTVCYFFFQDGQDQRSRGSNAISAILHQLLEKKSGSSLLSHALSSYKSYGKKLPGLFSELWDILVKSARDPDAGEIVCVLDALDECEMNDRKQLVEKLVGLFKKDCLDSPTIRLKFIVTSRPYDDLEHGFDSISSTDAFARLDGDEKSEEIGKEIHLVIDVKVPQIARAFSAEDLKTISYHLKSMDNHTYLWLFLTLDIIEKSLSRFGKMSSIEKLIFSLPSSVSDAYEKILSRSSNKKIAKILLEIIVAATRPLTLEEANIALSIATQTESCNSHKTLELWPSEKFKSNIQNMCGLFVSVYDFKIFLIHQTAREFLISGSESYTTSSGDWKGSIIMATAQGVLSRICLRYLNFEEFKERDWDTQSIEKQYPFLRYAGKEWSFHHISQDDKLAQLSREAAGMLCRTSLAQLSYWSPVYSGSEWNAIDFLDGWSELGIASKLGLTYVVEDFLNEQVDVNFLNGRLIEYGTALNVASAEGHEKVVEMLLDRNADISAQSDYGGTAIEEAIAGGHEKTIEMLLNHNADVNAENLDYGFLLSVASVRGQEKMVEILLKRVTDINAESERKYGTALVEASARGYEKIVKMLLNQNAEVNTEIGGIESTALMAATYYGHEKIVEMLLNQNVDVNAEVNDYNGTALIGASVGGHAKIVEVLLNRNADINAEGGGGFGTALIRASTEGHEKVVEILLNRNADINAESEGYGTALIGASSAGHETVVEMLLNHNANVNAESGRYGTALIGAVIGDHEKIVEILLNHTAEVNAESQHGTALSIASARGHEGIVEMLLNEDANINAEVGGIIGTALIGASVGGHGKIVEVLLNRNAVVDAESGEFGTALIGASTKGHEKVVEILLNRNADINAESEEHGTALIGASTKGHKRVVEMLLNHNADVNAEGGKYGTALIGAVIGDHEKIVEILLNHTAEVNAESQHGTALLIASAQGHEGIVEMLLNRDADVNAKDGGSYGTALIGASNRGHEKVVQMLLDRNADVNAKAGGEYGTALTAAACRGREKILEMLLNRNADVNAKAGGEYGTALTAAACRGREKIREMLLNRNADVNAKVGGKYSTALIGASAGGHEKIVEMLLNRNADVNANVDGKYGTALTAAACWGCKKIVEMLLNQNADINAESGECGTALIAASANGQEQVVEMLLNQNADINAKGGVCATALIRASLGRHDKIVEMLLDRNADVNAKVDGRYGTALTAAACSGRKIILEMLLNRNADVNAKSGEYGTALIGASVEGHGKIVEMLLSRNADVNAESGDYGTALIGASTEGHEKIVEMLLDRNADVNAESGKYGTALIGASAEGRVDMIEILFARNATAGQDLALERASAEGHEEVIRILLEKNPDIDLVGKIYRNALNKASSNLHVRSVEMLLDNMIVKRIELKAYGVALKLALRAAREDDNDHEHCDDNEDDDTENLTDRRDTMIEMLQERKRKIST
ncbi:hypothetical protein MMC07_005054 [Pseudocyphellaria aurata]|nr:hypothetical protein [Pseudocyphellaria aurata]